MSNFPFGELLSGCHIHLSHWLGFCCIWCQGAYLHNATPRSSSRNSSFYHLAGLSKYCSLMTKLLHMACPWPMNYKEADGIWKEHLSFWLPGVGVYCVSCGVLVGFRPNGSLILFLCSGYHSNLSFSYSQYSSRQAEDSTVVYQRKNPEL